MAHSPWWKCQIFALLLRGNRWVKWQKMLLVPSDLLTNMSSQILWSKQTALLIRNSVQTVEYFSSQIDRLVIINVTLHLEIISYYAERSGQFIEAGVFSVLKESLLFQFENPKLDTISLIQIKLTWWKAPFPLVGILHSLRLSSSERPSNTHSWLTSSSNQFRKDTSPETHFSGPCGLSFVCRSSIRGATHAQRGAYGLQL